MFPAEKIELLKQFVNFCRSNPEALNSPELLFFKDWMSSLGANIPNDFKTTKTPEPFSDITSAEEDSQDEDEPFPELDNELIKAPASIDKATQDMGDISLKVDEEMENESDIKKAEAMSVISDGKLEDGIELFTEAICKNPHSAVLFAKRAQTYLKLNCPNSAIKDCNQALELNPDSSLGFRVRGTAYCMLGQWKAAKLDLAQSLKIDFDPDTNDLLNKVMPNAHKLEEYQRRKERKVEEKLDRKRKEKIRKMKGTHDKAQDSHGSSFPDGNMPFGSEGFKNPFGANDNDFLSSIMTDPELLQALQDPEMSEAFKDISLNPGNISKYKSNPKVAHLLQKMITKFGPFPPQAFPKN